MYFKCFIFLAPLLKHLHRHITPHYAADWKVMGTLLGLPSSELNAIAAQNPNNLKWCCNTMLEKWLEVDSTASWEKIFTTIDSPAMSTKCESDTGGKTCEIKPK